jgi:hypothetical protein
MIEEANARSERAEECWPIADVLRVKGEPLLLQGAPRAAAVAEDHFRQALDWVRRQGALSWELAAASLTRLLQGRSADAVAPPPAGLRPVHRGLSGNPEGFEVLSSCQAQKVPGRNAFSPSRPLRRAFR